MFLFKRATVALVAGTACFVNVPQQASSASPGESRIGNWLVKLEKDPFSPKKKTIAVLSAGNDGVMAVRCFPDEGLSVLIFSRTDKEYDKDAQIHFKYRADEGSVVEDDARAFGPKGAILPNAPQILADAQKAGRIYLRIDTPDGLTTDLSFVPRGGSKALAQIVADCPAEPKASSDKNVDPKDAK